MNILKSPLHSLSITSLCFMLACTPDEPRTDASEASEGADLSKEEARARLAGKADDSLGFDICAKSGWYGDGVCDDFCDNPDPDCAPTTPICEQFIGTSPVCPAGTVEVGSCPDGACEQVFGTGDRCAEHIDCFNIPDFCPQTPGTRAQCPAGTEQVSSCVGGSEDCTLELGTGDRCGEFVLCEPSTAPGDVLCPQVVGDAPACPAGAIEVPDCPPRSSCIDVSGTGDRCDESITCLTPPDFCPAVPGEPARCAPGMKRVSACSSTSCTVALGQGDRCYDVALCEPGSPRKVRAASTPRAGTEARETFLNALGFTWVAHDKITVSESCTIGSARVSFDVTSLDGNDDVTVLVSAGADRGAWWLRLGPRSFEDASGSPLRGTYGYGTDEIRPDESPDANKARDPFVGMNSEGTWTIYAFEPDRDPLHDFVLEEWAIEFDCID